MKYHRPASLSDTCTILVSALFLFAVLGECMAQVDAEDWIERNNPDSPDGESWSLEYLQWLEDNPVDLNHATAELLCRIPGIDPSDAQKIVDFRTNNGPYQTPDELKLVPELPATVAQRLKNFVTVPEGVRTTVRNVHLDLRARTIRDLQLRDGYRTGVFHGSPDKAYVRLTGSLEESIEAGLLVEKDAGEIPSAGFISGYVSLSGLPGIDQFIAGDFRFEAGQGLVFWQGGGFGGNLVEAGARNPRGLIPHRSTDEFHFLRGLGLSTTCSLRKIPIRFAGFVSKRRLPGTVAESGAITGFHEDGLFRTEAELAKKDAINEVLIGGSMSADITGNLLFGIAAYANRFNRQVVLHGDTTSTLRTEVLAGCHVRWNPGTSELAGELAVDADGRPAWLVRGTLRTGRAARLVGLYRHYPSDFNGMHSAGFGARSDTRNERGCYFGFLFRPKPGIDASLFVDQFAFPRATATVPVPSYGYDAGINLDAELDARTALSFRTSRGKSQEVSAGADWQANTAWMLREIDLYRIRMTLVHEVTKNIRLKTRFERTGIQGAAGGKGTMLFQDIRVVSGGLSVDARLVFFQTDSYDTRIFEFESDVPGAFTVPVLYGTGRRWYVLARHEFLSGVLLSFKFAETEKEGVRTLGSGPSEIEGDKESRITVQLDIGI